MQQKINTKAPAAADLIAELAAIRDSLQRQPRNIGLERARSSLADAKHVLAAAEGQCKAREDQVRAGGAVVVDQLWMTLDRQRQVAAARVKECAQAVELARAQGTAALLEHLALHSPELKRVAGDVADVLDLLADAISDGQRMAARDATRRLAFYELASTFRGASRFVRAGAR